MKHLITKSTSGKVEEFLSDANLFMELSGLLVIGWQWLKQAVIAYNAIQMGSDTKFYESKIHTMKYYFAYELPKCSGLMTRLIYSEVLTIKGDKEYLL